MRKLWKWWPAGESKYDILIYFVVFPFVSWFSSDHDISLLHFMVMYQLLLFVVFCLWCSVSLFFRHYHGKK